MELLELGPRPAGPSAQAAAPAAAEASAPTAAAAAAPGKQLRQQRRALRLQLQEAAWQGLELARHSSGRQQAWRFHSAGPGAQRARLPASPPDPLRQCRLATGAPHAPRRALPDALACTCLQLCPASGCALAATACATATGTARRRTGRSTGRAARRGLRCWGAWRGCRDWGSEGAGEGRRGGVSSVSRRCMPLSSLSCSAGRGLSCSGVQSDQVLTPLDCSVHRCIWLLVRSHDGFRCSAWWCACMSSELLLKAMPTL
jgi:hypothetical protein